jgi:hypothetical protein
MAIGHKTGGRRKGVQNKRTLERRADMDELLAAGISPLEYMLRMVRDERADPAMRLEAARTAAPYCHPRLSAVDVGNSDGGPLVVEIVRFARDEPGDQIGG